MKLPKEPASAFVECKKVDIALFHDQMGQQLSIEFPNIGQWFTFEISPEVHQYLQNFMRAENRTKELKGTCLTEEMLIETHKMFEGKDYS